MAQTNTKQRQQAKKNPANEPVQVIIQKIDVRKPMRTEQDIPKWRQAIRSAEALNPRRKLLYTLYADVELDGHVESVVGKRKDSVTAANWQFVDTDGKPVDAVNQLIDTIGFDDLLNEIVLSRFWGYSVLEPKFWKGIDDTWEMSAGLLPRYHYRVEAGVISYDAIGDDGINIREGIYAKTVMEVGRVDDLGLYMKAAPYQVLKRGGLGDYAAFIQTFGNPIIDATWNGVDEAQRKQLQDALDGIGAGGNIVRPEGTNVEIKENRTKDTSDSHAGFIKLLNSEISKALLGTTETTEASKSSGYAQSKTHAEDDDDKHENDLAFVRKMLNSRFIRLLQTHGFDTAGGRFIIQGEETELDKGQMFDMHSKLVKEHKLPVDDDFWYETYGLPKPDGYEARKKELEERDNGEDPPEPPTPGQPKTKGNTSTGSATKAKGNKEEQEKEVELAWYKKLLLSLFPSAPAVTTGATTATCSHHHIKLAKSDQVDSDSLLRRIYEAGGRASFDAESFWQTSSTLIGGLRDGYRKGRTIELSVNPGFSYGIDDPAMLTAFEQNLFQFAGAKTLAQVQALNQLFRESKSFEEFKALASAQVETFNTAWLETEYNTAVLTGEAAATYNRLKAQADIFPYWEYKTAGDHLVRPAHLLLDGLILPANDPRWKKLFPPNGWNCRCYIVPRLANEFDKSKLKAMRQRADAYLNSPQGIKETATGWGVNRAESREVFTSNQQYIRKFAGKASKDLNRLTHADYNLPSYSQAKKAATAVPINFTGDAEGFLKLLPGKGKNKAVVDYNKRKLKIDLKNFARHTSDSNKRRAHRVKLLAAMEETLQTPDEVWLNGSALDDMLYVKYYQGQTIVVRGKIGLQGLELLSWFELAEKKTTIDKVRKGLLVFKK